jgi:outer membrane protein, multidrug efflux system
LSKQDLEIEPIKKGIGLRREFVLWFRVWRCLAVGGFLLGVAGCAVGPNYKASSADELGVPKAYTVSAGEDPRDIARWWDVFGAPVLTQLIARATSDNLTIAQASERLIQAREAFNQAQGARLPSLNLSASNGRSDNSVLGDSNSTTGQVSAAWSLDLFGLLARSQEASAASVEAAGYDLIDLRRTVASQVATRYVNYQSAMARLAIAQDTLGAQNDNLSLAGFRAQAGLVSGLDVEQARTQRAQTAASIPNLQQAAANSRNALSILVGQAPGFVDAMLAPPAGVPTGPQNIALGIPANNLRSRPDVRAAERNLAAATARIGVAKAQLYPQFTLSGTLATPALSSAALGEGTTTTLFESLAQTLFRGGNLRSQVRSQEAATRSAFAAYKATVLTSLSDVENGAVALNAANARAAQLSIAVEGANNAALLARNQYQSGVTDFRTLLSAEQALLSAREGLVAAKADQANSLIQLYLAVGGGWDPKAGNSNTNSTVSSRP